MIKAVIFDFDGVILESADIKTEAFRELFSEYPERLEEIVRYHLLNGGISRYVKFRHIYRNILGKKLSRDKEKKLAENFSGLSLKKVLKAPFVPGTREFLEGNKKRYRFFIASGTPHDELCNIVKARKLGGYFEEIHGTPRKKDEIIKDIMKKHGFLKEEVVYVGDADSDRVAAKKAGVRFIERKNKPELNDGTLHAIRDLFCLDRIIEEK
ncbi:MAG: HAD family hydrolase, partial [Candidatus Omnitrophica bacterium]|nr:HAD family hydrolase [Candidatus Omnitrophota bacterium]